MKLQRGNLGNWRLSFYSKFLVFVILLTIEVKIFAQYANLYELSLDAAMCTPVYTQFATDGTVLYGMTTLGGSNNKGVIFKINKDGTGFQKLLDFDGTSKGANPKGSLILSSSTLYGMTSAGGTNNYGVVFKIKTDGTDYQKLFDFDGTGKGANPYGALTISGSVLYGMTYYGGANSYGVIFKINTDGSGFQKLLDFGVSVGAAYPNGSLVKSGSTLYGMTVYAGTYAKGTIFKISTDGTGFTKLYNFDGTNSGANPRGSLTISGTKLYGMATYGGANNLGCIFSINTNGTSFTKLLDFDGTTYGSKPMGTLFLSGTVLYGATTFGGTNGNGCIFSINTDGTGFWKKWNLGDTNWGGYDNDGINPYGSVILIGNEIFGMTYLGGNKNAGTIFRIYDQSIGSSDGVYRKLRDCYPAYQGTHMTGDLVTDGTVLYGTAWDGGTNNKGTIFKINKDGSNFQDIYHFNTDLNGYTPTSVILSGSTLYGMTHDGGSYNAGIIFKMNTDGSGFQKLIDFNGNNNGAVPYGILTLIGSTLYGTTASGGSSNMGTVFKMNTDGSGFQKLVDFDGTTKGSYPVGSLTLSGSIFYGTTLRGGSNDLGVIFKINTNGSGFQKMLDFDGTNKGANPRGGSLTLLGIALYGMTENGGVNDMGVIFKINTNGSGFQKLLDFDSINNGSHPAYASLTIAGTSLYGITNSGGTNGAGIIFKINANGTGFQKIYDFDGTSGFWPANSLLLNNSTFYGTTFNGGVDNIGVIYKYDLTALQIKASGGKLTCAIPKINVDVTSNISGVTYEWSGPNSFTSTIKNPEVSIAGDYIVTVTYGSQSKTDTAKVTQDITAPGATATGGTITCTNTSVALAGSSSTSGVTYSWNGPNSFTSTIQNPTVSSTGTYNLTVTNPANGCTSTASATVSSNTTTPGATATGGTITCTNTSVTLAGNSSTSGVTYSWSGPNSFTSTLQNPTVSTIGTYNLMVTNPSNGCTSTASATVSSNTTAPGATATGGTITCTNTSVTLAGSSSTSGVTYSWSGPNSFTSTIQNPTVSSTGTYNLIVTNSANGCTSTASATVSSNTTTPGATATGGNITCTNTSVTLAGNSSTSGVTYSWSGPNSFTSTLQNPTVSTTGTYNLTVTNPSNGCTSTASATVSSNTTAPGASSSVSGTLTCNTTFVTLLGNSPTSGVTYYWSGPLIFSSTEQNPVTTDPGLYTVVVTDPVNGCTSASNVMVEQDTSTATDVHAVVSGNLTCTVSHVALTGYSATTNVTYSWSGPNGFVSSHKDTIASISGNYLLHVHKISNGCVVAASVAVILDTITPQGVVAEASGILSCTASSVTLTGFSSTSRVSYSWVGPAFSSTEAVASVTNPGIYTLTVTNLDNDCQTVRTLTVVKDLTPPAGATASAMGTLTCINQNVTITAASSTLTVAYSWSGPGNFTSNEQSPHVSISGAYSVIITNTYNNCFVTRSTEVTQNIAPPEGVLASATGILNCINHAIPLSSSSTTSPVSFNWSGPNGFTSSLQNPIVHEPGTYTLTVTSTANGCAVVKSVPVDKDTTPPGNVMATVSGDLNCVNAFVTLTGSSSTIGVDYYWTGPNNFEATESLTFAITPSVYSLTVTNPDNGCKDSANIMVVSDTTPPISHIIPPAGPPVALTDNVLSAQLVNDANYLWAFSSSNLNWSIVSGADTPDLTYHAGDTGTNATYSLTLTSNQNGCFSTSQIVLTAGSSLKSAREITSGIEKNKKEFQIKTYPNPFSDKAIIEFIPFWGGYTIIEFYRNDGILVNILFKGNVHKDQSYKVVIDGTMMSAGAYFFIVKHDNKEVYMSKMVLIK